MIITHTTMNKKSFIVSSIYWILCEVTILFISRFQESEDFQGMIDAIEDEIEVIREDFVLLMQLRKDLATDSVKTYVKWDI